MVKQLKLKFLMIPKTSGGKKCQTLKYVFQGIERYQ